MKMCEDIKKKKLSTPGYLGSATGSLARTIMVRISVTIHIMRNDERVTWIDGERLPEHLGLGDPG